MEVRGGDLHMVWWVVGSIPFGGPVQLFRVPAGFLSSDWSLKICLHHN